jgi:hypothetical protein
VVVCLLGLLVYAVDQSRGTTATNIVALMVRYLLQTVRLCILIKKSVRCRWRNCRRAVCVCQRTRERWVDSAAYSHRAVRSDRQRRQMRVSSQQDVDFSSVGDHHIRIGQVDVAEASADGN